MFFILHKTKLYNFYILQNTALNFYKDRGNKIISLIFRTLIVICRLRPMYRKLLDHQINKMSKILINFELSCIFCLIDHIQDDNLTFSWSFIDFKF